MSDYDDAVDAVTKAVVRIKYDVFKPPEVYAAELIHALVEIGYFVTLYRAAIKEIADEGAA